MQKFLTFVLLIAVLSACAILFIALRYEAIVAGNGRVIIFDKFTTSFIEKNAKGEWEKSSLKKGKIDIGFSTEEQSVEPSGVEKPKEEQKPKPEFKI